MRALLLLLSLWSHDDVERDRFKNPKDLAGYIAAQEAPDRAAWQKPEQILDALELKAGQTVCDIGSGPGYFALRAAKRVGEGGRVFAVDVEPRILDVLRTRIEKAHLRNVTPVLALATDPLLPPRSCDLVLIVDAYHHFPDRPRYLGRLAALLRPGGRLANVDWHKKKTASARRWITDRARRLPGRRGEGQPARRRRAQVAAPPVLHAARAALTGRNERESVDLSRRPGSRRRSTPSRPCRR